MRVNFKLLTEKIQKNKLLKREAMRNYVPPIRYPENLKPENRPRTDPATEKKMSELDLPEILRVRRQARNTWEKDRQQRVEKAKKVETVTNLMVGPGEENMSRYDLIMRLARQKMRASRAETEKYGYPLKSGDFGQETMGRIASTFERKLGKTLPPTGSGHY
jgi:hypothetical protein